MPIKILEVALERFKDSPTMANRLALDTVLDAHECATNHHVGVHPDCIFCSEEDLHNIPMMLQDKAI
jgi:hypothetical protein